ncbi:hypothetical protein GPECTOR_17g821 [Gonium pectorale]|uniref:Ribophorin II n=1 Tax=Gonium pectorale TaxID=33097 RepID=A0A150GK77_GONPE|nr:hypothetical protein GPECTOR_17g821 [Gonium pectorale]|eukprot:KXZ50184.1 hypothetical protein GPECTOR_17g821 [Gonium pectorale]
MTLLRLAVTCLLVQAAIVSAVAEEATKSQGPPELAIGDVKVVIKKSDGSSVSSVAAEYPKAVLSNPEVPVGGSLEVSLAVTKNGAAFKPQQVMLLLKSKSLGLTAYAVGKAKGSSYSLSTSAAALEKQIGKAPGEYSVSLLVGDPSVPKPIAYELGSVELLSSAASAAPEPAAVVRTAAFQPVNNLKPEIVHIFRAPEKRPPAVVSYTFALLALLPLAVVVVYVPAATGVNFKGLAVAPLYAMLFHSGLAAMLLLYFIFWTSLNLAQTLAACAIWGPFVAITGYLLLSRLSANRLKAKTD